VAKTHGKVRKTHEKPEKTMKNLRKYPKKRVKPWKG
jgi:hypothetical protein